MTTTPASAPTTVIYALLAFDEYPERDQDKEWLLANCDDASYALSSGHLPVGGFESQGMCEYLTRVDALVGSPEAEEAEYTTRRWLKAQREELDRDEEHFVATFWSNQIHLFDAGLLSAERTAYLDRILPDWKSEDARTHFGIPRPKVS